SDSPGPVAKMQQAARELETAAAMNRQPRPKEGVASVRNEEATFRGDDWLLQGSHGALVLGAHHVAILCLVYYLLVAGDMLQAEARPHRRPLDVRQEDDGSDPRGKRSPTPPGFWV